MTEATKIPKVFVSYSHDTPMHKRWVAEFASELVKKGIDVIIDQWDLGLGADVPKFMEKGLTEADRVLMICTEPYVRKADEGEGGVGYEAMIVTGELVQNLGTSKFIPIIRQQSDTTMLPKFMSTRFYVNLSNVVTYNEQFETLLRELHQVPAVRKPALGKNPFAITPSGQETDASSIKSDKLIELEITVEGMDCIQVYDTALEIARRGDLVAWRRFIRKTKDVVNQALLNWRAYNNKVPEDQEMLIQQTLTGVATYSPLICIALAGVESGRSKFNNQQAILDDIISPNDWNRAGHVVITDLPIAIAFFYQALHGAICLLTEQLGLAINFARTQIEFPGWDKAIPLWRHSGVMCCPKSISMKYSEVWKVLISLPKTWPWITNIFGGTDEYQSSLGAYYMALNINEYITLLALNKEKTLLLPGEQISLEIPLCFCTLDSSKKRRAYRLLVGDMKQVKEFLNTVRIDRVIEFWEPWFERCHLWLTNVYGHAFYEELPHKKLINEIKQ